MLLGMDHPCFESSWVFFELQLSNQRGPHPLGSADASDKQLLEHVKTGTKIHLYRAFFLIHSMNYGIEEACVVHPNARPATNHRVLMDGIGTSQRFLQYPECFYVHAGG